MSPPTAPATPLAQRARERFASVATEGLAELAAGIQVRYDQLIEQAGNARESQLRRDAWLAFRATSSAWASAVAQAWQQSQAVQRGLPRPGSVPVALGRKASLELMGKDVVETRILSSRLSLALLDQVSWELADLRLRIQHLEQIPDLHAQDLLRPEVLAQHMVAQWLANGLSHDGWSLVHDVIAAQLAPTLVDAYHAANAFLIEHRVMPEIDLRPMVRRTRFGGIEGRASTAASASSSLSPVLPVRETRASSATQLATRSPPLVAAHQRAESVLGELMRVMGDHADASEPAMRQPSASLATALQSQQAASRAGSIGAGSGDLEYSAASIEKIAASLRERSTALKLKAGNASEKATIEIVALMFQSILAEERIPAVVRVWFARLQMPVLRVAIVEPEFFGTLSHPARLLIDRMGACAMGFDAVTISGNALELEIKRIVQVIEQYPETGRRGFQLVLDEFQKFLAKYLTEQSATQQVVSVAQQVEQRETMAIQYTIELRNLLKDMPVRDTIRDFLFKVWAEVLALAAIKNGAQHADTLELKQTAADLVWAASAKPSRHERASVIADLPDLLKQLRRGMSLLGMPPSAQDQQIAPISRTLADAFQSKTDPIAQSHIEAMAERLANLENYLVEDDHGDIGDLPLDANSIEMMVGIDASSIEVLADADNVNDAPSNPALMALIAQLQLGSWYALDHAGTVSQTQFAWRSARGQLFLFASPNGRSHVIQARRLAACLATGLLVPQEDDALTVRATRDALARIEGNPAQLLAD